MPHEAPQRTHTDHYKGLTHTFAVTVGTLEPWPPDVVLRKVADLLQYGNMQDGPDLLNVEVIGEARERRGRALKPSVLRPQRLPRGQ